MGADNCTVDYYNYSDDWYTTNFDTCSADNWYDATEFTDGETGWGVTPNCTQYICPEYLDWSIWSEDGQNASFIWGPDLNFHNRIICRYSFYRNESGKYPTSDCEETTTTSESSDGTFNNPDTGIDDGAVVGLAIGCMVGIPVLVVLVHCVVGDKSAMK